MISLAAVWMLAATAAAFIPASGAQGHKQEAQLSAQSFLQKAAEGQQAEIVLGQLASERARDQQVKINDPQVQQWAEGTLPLLKQHLHQAQQIASSIGMDTSAAR